MVTERMKALAHLLKSAGPYLLLEVLLPGGTLFALLLFLHRNGRLRVGGSANERARLAMESVIARAQNVARLATPHAILAIARGGAMHERDGLEPLAKLPPR